jgi:hypothetical protein
MSNSLLEKIITIELLKEAAKYKVPKELLPTWEERHPMLSTALYSQLPLIPLVDIPYIAAIKFLPKELKAIPLAWKIGIPLAVHALVGAASALSQIHARKKRELMLKRMEAIARGATLESFY